MTQKRSICLVGLDPAVESALFEQLVANEQLHVQCLQEKAFLHGENTGDTGVIVAGSEADIAALRRACPGACLIAAGTGESTQADAVFKTPFRLGRLLSRIHVAIADVKADAKGGTLRIGPYYLRMADKRLTGGGADIDLTDKETEILVFLHDNRARVVSRDELLEKVWRYSDGMTTHTLETHIYRLRQKIEPDGTQPSVLLTEAGGYRLAPETA